MLVVFVTEESMRQLLLGADYLLGNLTRVRSEAAVDIAVLRPTRLEAVGLFGRGSNNSNCVGCTHLRGRALHVLLLVVPLVALSFVRW